MTSRLTILLPHGFDGGGPDHSTGHIERVLARCAKGNIQVANPSTPASFFHLLRRQGAMPTPKPLVVFSPKQLLRLRACTSPLAALEPGTAFEPVIAEDARDAERVVLCSGKIAYRLAAERAERGLDGRVAIVRLEQLYPFPEAALREALDGAEGMLVWVQEEPANLGPFTWLDRRLERAAGRRVVSIARPPAASPAAGWKAWHDAEEKALLDAAFDLERDPCA